jgi:hypothetical protein
MKQFAPSPAPPADNADYENDFVLWIERQAALLRRRHFEQLDVEHLIEELDAMGGSQRRELRSRLIVLIVHLLKCRYQPQRKSSGWIGTLGEQRSQIALLIEQSPSLGSAMMDYIDRAYPVAVTRAAHETRLPKSTFPATNPFAENELLDLDFIP